MPASKKKKSPPKKKPTIRGLEVFKNANSGPQWKLRLYVAGNTPNSIAAFNNLKQICETHLKGQYDIELIDLLRNPQLAKGDQIVAIPTLVRKLPPPLKQIIGDLSNRERVLVGLDMRPANSR